MLTVIGSPVSPYVRKVLAILALKNLPFEIDPIVAFYTDERFLKLNPVRRIPVLIDGNDVIADSSVIAAYLEEKHPSPSILPKSPADRARARWLEEFADTRMGDIFLWRCFNAVVIKPGIWGEERDLDGYRDALAGPVVEIMNYLESVAPENGFLFSGIGLGDISVSVLFRNMRYARWTPDPKRWPKTAAWVDGCEANSAMATGIAWADALMTVPVSGQRMKAMELGAPVADRTYLADGAPKRGPMTVI
jgi:glutathione S-transferase